MLFWRSLFGLALASACATGDVHAGSVGETHRVAHVPTASLRDAGHSDRLRITVWYPAPAGAKEKPLLIGPPGQPLFDAGSAAAEAPFAAGRHPIILLSHGFGGSARMLAWLGTALARAGYVAIAVDHPGNNGLDPMTMAGSLLIWQRAADLRAALEASQRDALIGAHLDRQRLGVAGFSMGGFTALLTAGARADIGHYLSFCRAQPGDANCAAQAEAPDQTLDSRERALATPALAAQAEHAGDNYAIPGVKAVFVLAPGAIPAIDTASLRRLRIPLAIVLGDADSVVPPESNGRLVARLVPNAHLDVLPRVGHYDFLARCTERGRRLAPPCAALREDQASTHAKAIAWAIRFFGKNLPAGSQASPAGA